MTETERQAEIMRREIKGLCLDCGEVHDGWYAAESRVRYWGWGVCDPCFNQRSTGPLSLKNAPPLLQNREGAIGVDGAVNANGLEIDRAVSAVEGQEAGAQ